MVSQLDNNIFTSFRSASDEDDLLISLTILHAGGSQIIFIVIDEDEIFRRQSTFF